MTQYIDTVPLFGDESELIDRCQRVFFGLGLDRNCGEATTALCEREEASCTST